ncbi:hypothetical protein RC62_568 [Flavobacterium aquidurense]|uniref:Uncharacterized protein n=1 Tax=Flavobacterium aquidurense TaxID=362413 RepID=A0A0N8VMP3_9FLAO|nr:hypothetical protein RC62_568 [Flavobacterium aquidurense]
MTKTKNLFDWRGFYFTSLFLSRRKTVSFILCLFFFAS